MVPPRADSQESFRVGGEDPGSAREGHVQQIYLTMVKPLPQNDCRSKNRLRQTVVFRLDRTDDLDLSQKLREISILEAACNDFDQ